MLAVALAAGTIACAMLSVVHFYRVGLLDGWMRGEAFGRSIGAKTYAQTIAQVNKALTTLPAAKISLAILSSNPDKVGELLAAALEPEAGFNPWRTAAIKAHDDARARIAEWDLFPFRHFSS